MVKLQQFRYENTKYNGMEKKQKYCIHNQKNYFAYHTAGIKSFHKTLELKFLKLSWIALR